MEQAPFLNLQRIFYEIYTFFFGGVEGEVEAGSFFLSKVEVFLSYLVPFSTIISLFLLTGIIYSHIRLKQIRKEEKEEIKQKFIERNSLQDDAELVDVKDERWIHIKELASSENINDWRQAVLNADIMLFEMLSNTGYAGESIGEMLKDADRSKFKTLDSAWEVHKVRNQIAHEGENFSLTERRTKEIINLYREVFQEFNYISS